ncbi:hypothetical protein [Agaribacter flavus]|uniref:Cytochrome oxidase Cu insertion factor, SCO1/SenC/PrrC family n=1 Tax=Agaribacter flavus TaxID=1902781 RepID=A0ABV7FQH0_9ALTE
MKIQRHKMSIVMLVVVFVLPVVLAKLALDQDWFDKGSTNRGQLLQPTIDATALLQEAEKKWHFVYVLPAECQQECKNAIYAIGQVKAAVGRESSRVNAVFLATEHSDPDSVALLENSDGLELLHKDANDVNKVFKHADVNAIFIADTLNNLVLSYPSVANKDQAIMDSRDMLADLRKLLKLSRIG